MRVYKVVLHLSHFNLKQRIKYDLYYESLELTYEILRGK